MWLARKRNGKPAHFLGVRQYYHPRQCKPRGRPRILSSPYHDDIHCISRCISFVLSTEHGQCVHSLTASKLQRAIGCHTAAIFIIISIERQSGKEVLTPASIISGHLMIPLACGVEKMAGDQAHQTARYMQAAPETNADAPRKGMQLISNTPIEANFYVYK